MNIQDVIKLPIVVINRPDSAYPDVIVKTPHKGEVTVKLKETHYPFLFGSVTQIERYNEVVLRELYNIENDAKDFLLKQWVVENSQEKDNK